MENGTSIDDILNDEPTIQDEAPVDTGQPRDEHGRFAAKDDETGEPVQETVQDSVPPTPEHEPAHIPVAALKDERAKRQQLEQQLAEYQNYFQQVQSMQAQQPAPDMYADPDGYAAYLAETVRDQTIAETRQAMQAEVLRARAEMTEVMARQKWQDYDDKVEVFKQAVSENPFLLQELHRAPNPAEYAYTAANNYMAAKQYGSVTPSREQLEAEIRQKIMAEINLPTRQAPQTLASERSVGARSGPVWSGPTSIGDILGR